MVKIRLQRAGAKNRPFYRVVAIDERRQRDGRALEFLGTYDPLPTPPAIKIAADRIEAWRKNGARLSGAVASLVRRAKKLAPEPPAAGGSA
jgi:small subunit ribosomal protein S16